MRRIILRSCIQINIISLSKLREKRIESYFYLRRVPSFGEVVVGVVDSYSSLALVDLVGMYGTL